MKQMDQAIKTFKHLKNGVILPVNWFQMELPSFYAKHIGRFWVTEIKNANPSAPLVVRAINDPVQTLVNSQFYKDSAPEVKVLTKAGLYILQTVAEVTWGQAKINLFLYGAYWYKAVRYFIEYTLEIFLGWECVKLIIEGLWSMDLLGPVA